MLAARAFRRFDDAGPPVDDGTEYVEREGLYVFDRYEVSPSPTGCEAMIRAGSAGTKQDFLALLSSLGLRGRTLSLGAAHRAWVPAFAGTAEGCGNDEGQSKAPVRVRADRSFG